MTACASRPKHGFGDYDPEAFRQAIAIIEAAGGGNEWMPDLRGKDAGF